MDTLSDVLRAVRLSGAVFFDVRAVEPWVAASPAGRQIVDRIFPGTDHLIAYHAVTRGHCWIMVGDGEPVALGEGDFVMLPQGDPHVVASAPSLRTRPNLGIYRRPADKPLPFAVQMGPPGSASAEIVCGFLGCDSRPYNPLLGALPRLIKVRDEGNGQLASFLRFAQVEAGTPQIGGEGVLALLSELMFVDVIRRYIGQLPEQHADWLAGLRDPFVGRALTALHREPARSWTVATLARAAGLSRSAFAERFSHFVGRSPMQYLAGWRMQLAANELRRSNDKLAVIANRAGYESEAAFSRAFKKAAGMAPRDWRQPARASVRG